MFDCDEEPYRYRVAVTATQAAVAVSPAPVAVGESGGRPPRWYAR